MLCDGAESTAAKTATHDVDGKLDRLMGGDRFIAVTRVGFLVVGQ